MAGKNLDWRPGPSVCRCCFAEGCYKDISTEYFWMGKREVYSEMLNETFDVSIAYSQSGGPNSNSRLICEPCISRLRDASDFKRQVLECEKTFMHHLDPGSSSAMELEVEVEQMDKEVKLERVKLERKMSEDDFDDNVGFGDDDDDDDLDDQPLTKLATKVPKKESVDVLETLLDTAKAEKRKSTIKVKVTPAKKPKKKEIVVKASASKTAAKPEKKKKEGVSSRQMAKNNAEVVLKYSTVYPFRVDGKSMLCVYCGDKFEDPKDFRSHMDTSHQTFRVETAFAHTRKSKEFLKVDCTDMKCRICVESFETIEEIAEHIHDFHDCTILDLKFDVGLQPYKMQVDSWACYFCDQKLPSLTKLARHTTTHYLQSTCEICGRSYISNEALKYHIRCSHSGKIVCRKCWQDFPTLEEKREHVKNSVSCWPFRCVHCREQFMSWEHKVKHLATFHGKPQLTYDCPDCGEKFEKRKRFYQHYKVAHTDESLECTLCGLKFGCKSKHEEHKLGHTGEKHFVCTVCDKSFSRKKGLIQHMWIHSEEKRFPCVVCDKSFAQKVSLKAHMKSHHPDVEVIL